MTNPIANNSTVTYFAITSSGGANLGTDLSQYVTAVTPNYGAEQVDVTTFGNSSRQRIAGFLAFEYALEGVWDTALDAIMFPLLGGTAAPIRYGPAGTASAKARHDSTAVLTAFNPPANVNDAVRWTASYLVSGPVTRTTF